MAVAWKWIALLALFAVVLALYVVGQRHHAARSRERFTSSQKRPELQPQAGVMVSALPATAPLPLSPDRPLGTIPGTTR